MQSPEDFVESSNTTYPKALLVAMIRARDAEWEARLSARDAEIRRECAERAVNFMFSKRWRKDPIALRAAIIGKGER